MNEIKLIDGLMMVNHDKTIGRPYDGILIILALIFVVCLLGSIMFEDIGQLICIALTIILLACIVVTCKYGYKDYYKVVITDNTKCTYEDVYKNYKIVDQEGAIYTIQLEDNE